MLLLFSAGIATPSFPFTGTWTQAHAGWVASVTWGFISTGSVGSAPGGQILGD